MLKQLKKPSGKFALTLSVIGALCLPQQVMAGEKVDELLNIKADGRVRMDIPRGKVKISTWDESQIKIVGELAEVATGYQLETNEGFTTFKVHLPQKRYNYNNWDDGKDGMLEITLPTAADVDLKGVNTNVSVSGVQGGTDIDVVNGDVIASMLENQIRIETVNGDIQSTKNSGRIRLDSVNGEITDTDSKGRIDFETVNGDILVKSAAEEIRIENVNGDIDLALKEVADLEVTTVNGDIDGELTMKKGSSILLTTVSGDAELTFIGDVTGAFALESHASGDIRNRLTKDKVIKEKYGPGEYLRFVIGNGNSRVEMSTVNGDLLIKK